MRKPGTTRYRDGYVRVFTIERATYACLVTGRKLMRVAQARRWTSSSGYLVGYSQVEDFEHHAFSYGVIWRYDLSRRSARAPISLGQRAGDTVLHDPVVTPNGTVAWIQEPYSSVVEDGEAEVHVAPWDGASVVIDRGPGVDPRSLGYTGSPYGASAGWLVWVRDGLVQTSAAL